MPLDPGTLSLTSAYQPVARDPVPMHCPGRIRASLGPMAARRARPMALIHPIAELR